MLILYLRFQQQSLKFCGVCSMWYIYFISKAIERGVHFEICYTSAIRDTTARRYIISNAQSLVNVCKGNVSMETCNMRILEYPKFWNYTFTALLLMNIIVIIFQNIIISGASEKVYLFPLIAVKMISTVWIVLNFQKLSPAQTFRINE